MKVYLDNASTTPLKPQVKEYITSLLDQFYNPSSLYGDGLISKDIIEKSRHNIAKFINARNGDIIFTSGGSASNTLAIRGYSQKNNCNILYMPTCHKSILKCVERIKRAYPLKVDSQGFVDLTDLREWLDTHENYLVVIEYANSEIGTVQHVKQIIELCHFYNARVYIDCTGSISQIPVDIEYLNPDMIGFSAHKLGALKGCGVLYKKHHIELEPLIYGSQELGLFSGTENFIGIVALSKAIENYDYSSISSTNRNIVYSYIQKYIPDSHLIGAYFCDRLPHNLYMCFEHVQGESLMILMDTDGIQISTGSACTSKDSSPSSTLLAIGLDKKLINNCIRISFSGNETQEELDFVCQKLKKNIELIRNMND